MQGVAVVRFTPELSQWDPETFVRTVLVDWLRVVGSLGRRELPVRPRSRRQLHAAARRSARATGSAPRRSIRSATRTSSSAARASAGWSREGRVDEAGALLGHHYFIDGTVVQRRAARPRARVSDREPVRPRTSCCRRTASMRRRVTIDGIVHPSVTNIGLRPTFGDVERPVDRDARLRRRPRSVRRARAAVVRAAAARRARVPGRRRAARADRRRLPERRGGCSAAFRCRIVPYDRSPDVAGCCALTVPGGGRLARASRRSLPPRSRSTSAIDGRPIAAVTAAAVESVAAAGRTGGGRRRDRVRFPRRERRAADRGRAAAAGRPRCDVRCRRDRPFLRACRPDPMRSVQHADPPRRRLRAGARQHASACTPAA